MPANSEKLTCPICKESQFVELRKNATSVYTATSHRLASCRSCDHLFLPGSLCISELNRLYDTVYSYESHLVIEKEKKWRAKRTILRLKQVIPLGIKIIDVGCMYRFFLDALRELKYSNLMGIETDVLAAGRCREKGFNVFTGTFSQWRLSNLDKLNNDRCCILLSHTLEHIPNIDEFFSDLSDFLKSGCYLVIMAPNSKARTTKLFKAYWGWWQIPLHISHFSKKSISNLLLSNGFRIESIFKTGADSLFWLSTLASLLGIKSKSRAVSSFQKIAIKVCSVIMRYWFFLGDEELVVVGRKIR